MLSIRKKNTNILILFYFENKTSSDLITNINKTVHDFNQDITNKARGTTYIRWSRKHCPNSNNTELVYSGYTGGGYAGDTGAAPEAVCLPLDPDFSKISGAAYSRMHGAEFKSNFFSSNSAGQDLPCAMCRVKKASSIIMIPGKNRCYTGWHLEYHGYLSSGRYDHSASSSYICVDINPEYVTGGSSNKNDGKYFYEVFAICGSLNCPPYHNAYPMTSVVCSK